MQIKLNQPFAADGAVDPFDVKQMKKALNRLGYYQPYEKVGVTGIPDGAVFAALKNFQEDHNLPATGGAKPDDATIQKINEEAAKTPQGQYIWRTVDDEKVRSSHKALNGTVRDWSDSPDPGEEFNCRCWAKNVTNSCENQRIAWINADAEVFIATQNLEKQQSQKSELEILQRHLEEELQALSEEIKKEKSDKESARRFGGIAGGALGGFWGMRKGPGGAMAGFGLGLGPGSKFGSLAEEVIDIIAKQPTDISLETRKAELEKSLQKIQNAIRELEEDIKNNLEVRYKKSLENLRRAKSVYEQCVQGK